MYGPRGQQPRRLLSQPAATRTCTLARTLTLTRRRSQSRTLTQQYSRARRRVLRTAAPPITKFERLKDLDD